MDIVTEIQQLEMLIASYTHKGDEVRGMVEDSKRQLRAVQDALKLEELRRQSAIENAVQDSQKQRLLKQVADFEIAKAMHRRELDRIAAVTAVYERRNKDRTKDSTALAKLRCACPTWKSSWMTSRADWR
jgi:CHASE3 domain sensor protein